MEEYNRSCTPGLRIRIRTAPTAKPESRACIGLACREGSLTGNCLLVPGIRHNRRAFTLVEVILALIIMVGILTVVLFFYQRIEATRRTVLEEAESITLVRLLMDQMAGELRMARASDNPVLRFEGSSNALRFHTMTYLAPTRWLGSNAMPGDLRRVYYGLSYGTNETEVLGVQRSEELPFSLASARTELTGEEDEVVEDVEDDLETAPDFLDTITETNGVAAGTELWSEDSMGALLTDRIRFLRLRYFDGLEWRESWGDTRLPRGIEITLATEPMSEESSEEEYPFDQYRRWIFLPGSEHPANRLSDDVDQEASP